MHGCAKIKMFFTMTGSLVCELGFSSLFSQLRVEKSTAMMKNFLVFFLELSIRPLRPTAKAVKRFRKYYTA